MITSGKTLYRPARREDAAAVAELFALAGHGIAEYLWSLQARDGQGPLQVGTERARRDDAIQAYERGANLKRHCEAKLAEARLKVDKISFGPGGEIGTQPMDRD